MSRFPRVLLAVRRRLARAAAILLTLAICSTLSACGSGGSSSPSTSAASAGGASSNRTAQQLKFAVCMRAHGVPIRDPSAGPQQALSSGVPGSILKAAIAACRQYFVGSTIAPQDRSKFTQALVKYATCLRANGIDVPDPSGTDNGFSQKLLAAESMPNFQRANSNCRRTLPAQFRGATAG